MSVHKIYVYGTLMRNVGEKFKVPGLLYDIGSFPGARIDMNAHNEGPWFIAECIEADDAKLEDLDHYEGYDKKHPSGSLYIRRPYLDGWIYEYNSIPPEDTLIESGDWRTYYTAKRDTRFSKGAWREDVKSQVEKQEA